MWWMVVAAWSWPVFQNGPDHGGGAPILRVEA